MVVHQLLSIKYVLELPSEASPWSKLCAELIFASFRSKRSRFSVYVDISDPEEECSTLAFDFKDTEVSREWNITILQIPCDFENRAPPGCLQYFFGLNENGVGRVIKSFNFDGGYHLGVLHVYNFKFLESTFFFACESPLFQILRDYANQFSNDSKLFPS